MNRRGPPCITGRGFKPKSPLTPQHISSLCVPGPGAGAEAKLNSFSWNGKIAAYITLVLSNDNKTVANGTFNLIGSFSDQPLIIPVKKIWGTNDDTVSLKLALPDGRIFLFSEGGLTSDYINGENCTTSFFLNNNPTVPTPVQEDELLIHGIGSFSLRAFAVPVSANSVKVWILAFPADKEGVLSHPLGRTPAWPHGD